MKAREINSTIRYTMWSVFRRVGQLDDPPMETADATVRAIDRATKDDDLVIRGWYDVAGLRADADLMVWWHAPSSDTLQNAYHALRRSDLGAHLVPVWSQLALHRPAEFNKGHVPAFMAGRGGEGVPVRLSLRTLLRVVSAAGGGTARHAHRARHAGPALSGRTRQHRVVIRSG